MEILAQTKAFLKARLPEPIVRKVQSFLYLTAVTRIRGLDFYLKSPDRDVLENSIIPYFVADNQFYKVLFVGCDWYTNGYKKYFRNQEYWTIDVDPSKSKYGAKNHINDALQNLSHHIKDEYFDLIIYNGVFGHGINSKKDTEASMSQCFQCLREGGILVFGWNDIPEFKPFPVIEECENLKKFKSYFFPPLSTSQYLASEHEMRHTFNFFIKPVSA